MQFDRRAIAGPALAAATALGAVLVDNYLSRMPNPASLLVCIVAFAGSLSGLGSATISAAIAIIGSALFFLNHRATPGYDEADLIRLAMLAESTSSGRQSIETKPGAVSTRFSQARIAGNVSSSKSQRSATWV